MKKKMFAALALSATLAMGAVPAFADEPVGTEVGNPAALGNDNATTTTVSVKTVVGQINAKIPITATIAAQMTGGAITAPSDDTTTGYRIENSSIFPIKVTAATATAGEGWVLKKADISSSTDPDATSTTIGDICLKLTPSGGSTAWNMNEAFATSDEWIVGAGTAAAPEKLGLKLEGSTSSLRQAYENTPVKAVTVAYTIGASPAKAADAS